MSDDLHVKHGVAYVAFGVGAALLGISIEVPLSEQLVFLALGVAMLGIPHGALDLSLLRSRRWMGIENRNIDFLLAAALYVVLAAAVLFFWVVAPVATLVAFLAVSLLHFGLEDAATKPSWSVGYSTEFMLRGAIPIGLPIALHPSEATLLFGFLVPEESATVIVETIALLWPLIPGLAFILLASQVRSEPRKASSYVLLELGVTALLFVLLPPILAFAIYFSLLHSVRHLIRFTLSSGDGRPSHRFKRTMTAAVPATVLTWIAIAGFWFLSGTGAAFERSIAQLIFVGLAALTLPHVLLLVYLRRGHGGVTTLR